MRTLLLLLILALSACGPHPPVGESPDPVTCVEKEKVVVRDIVVLAPCDIATPPKGPK
jgi:hypothetical protein